jgi:hypothetical protein
VLLQIREPALDVGSAEGVVAADADRGQWVVVTARVLERGTDGRSATSSAVSKGSARATTTGRRDWGLDLVFM